MHLLYDDIQFFLNTSNQVLAIFMTKINVDDLETFILVIKIGRILSLLYVLRDEDHQSIRSGSFGK